MLGVGNNSSTIAHPELGRHNTTNGSSPTITPIDVVIVTEYFNNSSIPHTLGLMVDDIIYVLSKPSSTWWDGVTIDPIGNITRGWFPPSRTKHIDIPNPSTTTTTTTTTTTSTTPSTTYRTSLATTSASVGSSDSNFRNKAMQASNESHHGSIESLTMTPRQSTVSSIASSQHSSGRQYSRTTISDLGDQKKKHSMAGSIKFLPPGEIDSYFQPKEGSKTSSRVSFEFSPVWLPELTADDNFVFYDQALDTYSKKLPMIHTDSKRRPSMEIANTSQYAAGHFSVPISLSDSKSMTDDDRKRSSSESQNTASSSARNSVTGGSIDITRKRCPNIAFCSSSHFYFTPTDVVSWNSLNSYFKQCVEATLDALSKRDKKLFRNNLNFVSTTVATYQMIVRILADAVKSTDRSDEISHHLKKVTSSLIHFIINGNLFLLSDAKSAGDQASTKENIAPLSDISGKKVNASNYWYETRKAALKMLKHSLIISDLLVSIPSSKLENSRNIPLIYARFLREGYEGGNYYNQLVQDDATLSDNKGKSNILLDDHAVRRLREAGQKISDQLKQVNSILDRKPSDDSYTTLVKKQQLDIFTSVYRCIPQIFQYFEILESIDITLFALITRLADRPMQHGNICQLDTTSSNRSSDSSNSSEDDSNILFYKTMANNFKPSLNEFLHLKQDVHSLFSNLILDCEMLTAEDSEVFESFATPIEEQAESGRSDPRYYNLKTEGFARDILKVLKNRDERVYDDKKFIFDLHERLRNTLNIVPKNISLMLLSVSRLCQQRQLILNACSRMMNTDFHIASLFIVEQHNTRSSVASQSDDFYADRKVGAQDRLPWYLDIDDDERQLIYNPRGLRGGPIMALISKLVDPNLKNEYGYAETFLSMFRTFITPEHLFELLVEKYNMDPPSALSYEEYTVWVVKRQIPMQKAIIRTFQKLFTQYWNVSYNSPFILDRWNYTCKKLPIDRDLKELGNIVISMKDQNEYSLKYDTADAVHIKHEVKELPKSLSLAVKAMRLHTLDTDVLSKQITMLQQSFFDKIDRTELLSRSFNFNKINHHCKFSSSKNISKFIKNCNQLTHFTIYMILRQGQMIPRITTIKYFVALAEKLLEMNNFCSMTAIISGLGSVSVSRLKKTWALVPKQTMIDYKKMCELMSIGKNYNEYRNMLKFLADGNDPCLPFLGMYLSDLRFTADGNPNYLHDNRLLINFSKREKIFRIIDELMHLGGHKYSFKRNVDIIDYLLIMFANIPNDEILYKMSLKWEPRVSLLSDIKSKDHHSKSKGSSGSVLSRVRKMATSSGSLKANRHK